METRSQVITNKKAPILPLYGWVIVLGLLAWSIWTLWPRQQAVVDMPYSTFLEQVQAGNVSQVTFTGSDITGTLVNPQPITGSAVPTAYSSTFHTRFPEVAGDSNLVTLLMIHRVQVNAEPSPQPWYLSLLTDRLPLLLLAATAIYIFTRVSQRQPALLNFNGKAQRIYSIEHPRTTFNDVAGDDEAKTQIRELINPLRRSSNDDLTGAKIPRGVLLVGMPGTGKRLLARAAAGEMKTPLIYICASALAQMEIGTGPNQIHSLFQQARKMAPSIIFIDELEALGCQENRVNRSEPEPTPVLNQLFWEMEHLNERAQILVLAATHRPDQLEPALLKPGRFDRQIAVDLPDRAGREGILKIHTRDLRLSKNVNLGIIARSTTGLSGADLAKLCQEASQAAARKNTDQVSMADFEEALDRILLTAPRQLLSAGWVC